MKDVLTTSNDLTSVFYINLDRAGDRRVHMDHALAEQGLADQSERIPAIDAKSETLRDAFRRRLLSPVWALEPGVIACFESHRKAWTRFLETNASHALFLEDDIVFAPGFSSTLNDLIATAPEFDCLKLDGNPFHMRLGPVFGTGSVRMRVLRDVTNSTGAYVLSRAGAQRLLSETETYSTAVDTWMYTPRRDWVQYQCTPAICVQAVLISREELDGMSEQVAESDRLEGELWFDREDKEPTWWMVKRVIIDRLTRKWPTRLWGRRINRWTGGDIAVVPLKDDFATYRW